MVGINYFKISTDVNTLTIPPCEYTCKSENKKKLVGPEANEVKHVV